MRKTLLLLSVLLTSLSMFAATNLTSGKTVVPLGGLKTGITLDNLQLITTDGNTANVFLLPEPSAADTPIQGFYIDLGEAKSIGAIQSTWEGADCGAKIYVTNTEPAADGSLTGETLIATFTNAQEATKDAEVTVDNSGRYIVFVPTEATNYTWGVKIRTFVAYDKYEKVLTTLDVTADRKTLLVGKTTNLTVTAKDQIDNTMEPGTVTWTSSAPSVGTVADGVFTAIAAGTTTITAAAGGKEATVDITVVAGPDDIPALATTGDITKIYTGEESASGYEWAAWGAATKGEGITVNGKGAFMMSDFTYYGSQFDKIDASGATKLHFDVYALNAGKLAIVPICRNSETSNEVEKGTEFTLTAGEWNSLDIAIDKIIDEDGVSMKEFYQIKYEGSIANKAAKGAVDGFADGEGDSFIVGNVYLITEDATEDTEAPVMTKAEATSIDATEVTLTVSATDNETRSLTYKVFNGEEEVASGTGTPGEDATVKVTGLTKKTEYTLTVKAVDKAGNISATGKDVNFTTADLFIPETNPTEPTFDADDVLAVYSAKYDKGLVNNNPGWGIGGGAPNPLYTSVEEVEIADGHKVVHVNGTGFNNRTKDEVALSDAYSYVYVALYPKTATSCKIFGDNLYANAISVTDLVPNQWNYVKVANTIYSTNYILVELVGETEFYLDHFYFKKLASDECVVSAPNAQDIVTVKGTITNENKSEIEALTDAMVDLSGAAITATSLKVTGNPNAVLVVAGEVGAENVATTTQTAVAGNRVVKDGGYYFPVEQLQFVDDPKNGLWTGYFISGNAAGWKYTRTLKANTYNTVVVPIGTTVPEGATAYQLSAYADGTVTFNEIEGAMAAGEPFLVKVGDADVTIEIESKNDFNIVEANAKATEKDGATFKANYKKQDMSDVYVLATGTTTATFKKAASANIGSCRAYLTGVAPASSGSHELTIVLNGETTKIGTIKADGTIDMENTVIYDLNGRRVKNPTKGIYIVNGKKVIIK